MDKATLTKKSVLALERLAKKVGAKTVTPEGKKKNKTQLVNSIVMASRLGKKAPGLKAKAAPAKKIVAKRTTKTTLRGVKPTLADKEYYSYELSKPDFTSEYPGKIVISAGGKSTKPLNINKTSLPIIVRFFTKLQKTKPGAIATTK